MSNQNPKWKRVANTFGVNQVTYGPTSTRKSKLVRYVAKMSINGNNLHVGTFTSVNEAAKAYNVALTKAVGKKEANKRGLNTVTK